MLSEQEKHESNNEAYARERLANSPLHLILERIKSNNRADTKAGNTESTQSRGSS